MKEKRGPKKVNRKQERANEHEGKREREIERSLKRSVCYLAIRVKNHSVHKIKTIYLRHREEKRRKKNATKCCGFFQ